MQFFYDRAMRVFIKILLIWGLHQDLVDVNALPMILFIDDKPGNVFLVSS